VDESQQAGDELELAPDSTAQDDLDNGAEGQEQQYDEEGNPIVQSDEEDDTEEAEYEGKKGRVPKGWRDALMLRSDYTQKTQALADDRRQFETIREQTAQALHLQHQVAGQVAGLIALDNRLAQFEQLDWNALSQQNPAEAQRLWIERSQLLEQRQARQQQIGQAQQQVLQHQQTIRTKQAQEGTAQLVKEGWTAEDAKSVKSYGLSVGFTEADFSELYNPLVANTLRKAMLWDRAQAKAKEKPKTSPSTPPKPAAVVAGKTAASSKDMDRLSTDEWMKERNKQVKQQRTQFQRPR